MIAWRSPAAVAVEAAACNNIVNVRMIAQITSPGVQDADHTQLSTEVTGIAGKFGKRSR